MSESRLSRSDEVDHLMLNAQLRDELEPFLDEAVTDLNSDEMPTPVENAYLASMLAWERAPVLPIAQWFDPPLELPPPGSLDEPRLHELLWDAIDKLFDKRIVLEFTDHLTDRQFYTLIVRDILPSQEKRIENSSHYLHWDCADIGGEPDIWLQYYASDEERQWWRNTTKRSLPPKKVPPYPRQLPTASF